MSIEFIHSKKCFYSLKFDFAENKKKYFSLTHFSTLNKIPLKFIF